MENKATTWILLLIAGLAIAILTRVWTPQCCCQPTGTVAASPPQTGLVVPDTVLVVPGDTVLVVPGDSLLVRRMSGASSVVYQPGAPTAVLRFAH